MASQLNDLLKEVRVLEDFATDYWISNADDDNNKQLEVKIRGTSFAIAAFEEQIDKLFHNRADAYRESIDLLIMCCTGGGFETADRTADPLRATEARQLAAGAAATIRRARQDSAGLIALVWEAARIWKRARRLVSKFLNVACDLLCYPFGRAEVLLRRYPLF